MKRIHHRHWHTTVHLHGRQNLYGRTTFLSTDMECAASLQVNKFTFQIEKARWSVFRGPGGPCSEDIIGLRGVESYLGSGESLRRAVLNDYGERALSLIAETVRGIIQAETFIYRERGYKNAGSYDSHWEKMYLNTCRYYSNLDRITRRWEDHVSVQRRDNNLFNRFKEVLVSEGADTYQIDAGLSDSFHEAGISLTLDKGGTVRSAEFGLLRGPDPVCREAGGFGQNLLGIRLHANSKKEIAGALGGGQGCVHMIDLCYDTTLVMREILMDRD